MIISSEQEMVDLGREIGHELVATWGKLRRQDPSSIVIELLGDVGAGKTTFVRGLAEGLGIKEPVTSPSFTISKAYTIPSGGTLVHYDFYRLPDPGIMAEDLEEAIKTPNNIVMVEWANTVADLLPKDRVRIEIKYNDDGTRKVALPDQLISLTDMHGA